MSEHVHFFSLGKHSFTTYLLTMKEVKPTKVYLICDQYIYDKGNNAYEILNTAKREKKITKLPTLWDMHKLLGNPLEAMDSSEVIIQNRVSALENLVPQGFKSEKEFASDWEKILFLEKETGIANLKVIDKEAYAVREARTMIVTYQNFINRCHDRFDIIKRMNLSDEAEIDYFINGNIPENIEYLISLIREECDMAKVLCPELMDNIILFTDEDTDVSYKKLRIYREAKKLITAYPHVTLQKEPVIVKKRDYNTVCSTIFKEISDANKNIRYSMNISAGVNQFCMSLFVLGCWLKADLYLTPTADEIINLPLPSWSGRKTKIEGDQSTPEYRKAVLLTLYEYYITKIAVDNEKNNRYSIVSKMPESLINDGLSNDDTLLLQRKEIIRENEFKKNIASPAVNTPGMTSYATTTLAKMGHIVKKTIKFGEGHSKEGFLLTESGMFICRMLKYVIEYDDF